MIFSWMLGIIIFSYAGYTLYRHVQRSKEGKCAICEVKNICQSVEKECFSSDSTERYRPSNE